MISLGQLALRGLMMLLAQNVVARACSLLSQLALASLLRPADFGLIGLTYSVVAVVSILTNLGIEDVVIRRRPALYIWSGAVFWINLGLSTGAAVLVLLAAPVAATAYGAPQMVGLLAILASSMPLAALSSVPAMILKAQMRFGLTAAYGAVENVATVGMTIALAADGFGAYSFVIPIPLLALIRAIAYWSFVPDRPGFRAHTARWKYLTRNTAATLITRMVYGLIGQGDYIILGLLASQDVVGQYYFGFRLAAQPVWTLAGSLTGTIYPALAQLRQDPQRQGQSALRVAKLLSYCIMPIAFTQAAIAGPLVTSFFGQKWASSIPVIQLLSIGLALDAISWVGGALLTARGEFVASLRYSLMQAPAFFLLIAAGALLDKSYGVAWAVCIYYAISQPPFVYAVFRRVGVSLSEVARIYIKPTICAAIAVGIGLAGSLHPLVAGHPLARAGVICAVGAACYLVIIRYVSYEIWRELTALIHRHNRDPMARAA